LLPTDLNILIFIRSNFRNGLVLIKLSSINVMKYSKKYLHAAQGKGHINILAKFKPRQKSH